MSQQAGFHFVVCPDSALLRLAVDELVPTLHTEHSLERLVFWGDEELPARFWEAITLQSFLPVLRLIVLRNAQNLPAETWKRLSRTLARPNAQCLPVFCLEGPWEKGQPKILAHLIKIPLYTFAVEKGWVIQRPGLNETTLKRHVQQLCRQLGLAPEPGVVEALAAVLPQDATAVKNEMEKLALYAASRGRTQANSPLPVPLCKDDVTLVAHNPDFNIFTLIRQLQSGQPSQTAAAWQTVLREQAKGEELIFPLLGLMQREARFIWQTLHNETERMNPRDADSRRALATTLGVKGLADLWDAMHGAELAIKSGRLNPAQALDAFMGELTRLFTQR